MEVMYARCAGFDVHKESVVAAVRVFESGKVRHEVRTFATATSQLLKLSDWLMEQGCSHVAMEATGIYWKPIWAVLESRQAFELVLANAKHVKNVPGRKTDVNDATWLADLLAHGMIRPSFVPPAHVQEMRDLSRTREQFVREGAAVTLRIQKLLESVNIKLSSVLSDILGESGRAILNALAEGSTTPEALSKLVNYRVKATPEEIKEALNGVLQEHHRFMLKLYLEHFDSLDKVVRELEARLGETLKPFREKLSRVIEVPGLSERNASAIIAEIGDDMTRFKTANHLVAWANLCPQMDESAGKKRNTRIGKGGTWLKPVLVQAAWCAVRTKSSYLRKKFMRLKGRRGPKKAIVAVAASMLRAIWHLLSNPVEFKDLGFDYEAPVDLEKAKRRLVRRLENLGYNVELRAA